MATPTKILSRVRDPLSGEEYYIGTVGAEERLAIRVSAPATIDWTQYSVTVQNLSAGTVETKAFSAEGECIFYIPMGNVYVVLLPTISPYAQPEEREFAASLANREIIYTYAEDAREEEVYVRASVRGSSDTVAILTGLTVSCVTTDSITYTGTFNVNGIATINVPYGKTYNLILPEVEGYVHDHTGEHHTAGIPSRDIIVLYTARVIGVRGMDDNGNLYSIDEVTALADKSIITHGYYNDSDLQDASRGDGTTGCGFCWLIDQVRIGSGAWANYNEDFRMDESDTRLPYITNETAGLADCHGKLNTEYILEIVKEKNIETPSRVLTAPAAAACAARSTNINGVDRTGFLPAYGQLKRLALNQTYLNQLYTALGKTAPNLNSGHWWVSCQQGPGAAVYLVNGGFYSDDKTVNDPQWWCAFDIQ